MGDVTVLGLGLMGASLARGLMKAGHRTVVWNRTAARAEPLVADGARSLADPADAIAESPVGIVCVDDYDASESFLATSAVEGVLPGRVLVQLSSGSPARARAMQSWAQSLGTLYLDGAIMAFPSQIAGPEALILVAGDRTAYDRAESTLRALAPEADYLGGDAGLASVLDEALLSTFVGAVLGAVNGAALCEAGGVSLRHFRRRLDHMFRIIVPSTTQMVEKIADDDLVETEASLQTWAGVLDYMIESASSAGFSDEFPRFARDLFRRAMERGLGEHDVAALIEVLRPRA